MNIFQAILIALGVIGRTFLNLFSRKSIVSDTLYFGYNEIVIKFTVVFFMGLLIGSTAIAFYYDVVKNR